MSKQYSRSNEKACSTNNAAVNVMMQPYVALDNYRDEIDELGLNNEQAKELLTVLHHFMQEMVNIGWGMDSTNMALSKLVRGQPQKH